jgi:hypothetical protein
MSLLPKDWILLEFHEACDLASAHIFLDKQDKKNLALDLCDELGSPPELSQCNRWITTPKGGLKKFWGRAVSSPSRWTFEGRFGEKIQ